MQRYIIWYVLAFFWAGIAGIGFLRHHRTNAALESAFALLFVVIGMFIKRRDNAVAARYTARRPR
jgi:hypothetical protein